VTTAATELLDHPLAGSIQSLPSLRVFMEHHVFAVWDFLLLARALQHQLAKACSDGPSLGQAAALALIHQIVAEEERDLAPANALGASHLSHLKIYLLAMGEVGACTAPIEQLMARLQGVEPWALNPVRLNAALSGLAVAEPCRQFMAFTFEVIGSGSVLAMAAAFTHGRELLVPQLFKTLLERALIPAPQAPSLHWYLHRHVAIDSEAHGPGSLAMLGELCGRSGARLEAARTLGQRALVVRHQFWDGIQTALDPPLPQRAL